MSEWLHQYLQRFQPSGLEIFLLLTGFAVAFPAGARAQDEVRPAEELFSETYEAEIGRTLVRPQDGDDAAVAAEIARCQATCDAFVPRQPIFTLEWENAPAGTSPEPAAQQSDSGMRLDISGTATGFDEGQFATIPLTSIPVTEAVVPDPVGAASLQDVGGVLFNMVENGQIVEREADLPIFLSPDAMSRGLDQLEPQARARIEEDQLTGSLSQVRVLERGSTLIEGESRQVVTVTGLQPGATYRMRLVDEQDSSAETVFEQICRIPVCPADFVDPGQ